MMIATGRTLHASAVLAGEAAVLIRGPSGAGKSRLALDIIDAAVAGLLPFARLVGDDRVLIACAGGRLVVSPAPSLAGLVELRGLGIVRRPHEAIAAVGLVVDLGAEDGARMPEPAQRRTALLGVELPRLPVAPGVAPLPLVLAAVAEQRVWSETAMEPPLAQSETLRQ